MFVNVVTTFGARRHAWGMPLSFLDLGLTSFFLLAYSVGTSVGGSAAAVGGIEAAVGEIEAAAGQIEAATGRIEAAMGGIEAATGGIEAVVGGIEAEVGAHCKLAVLFVLFPSMLSITWHSSSSSTCM